MTDWSKTLGLNLVAHSVPAAHWYHRSFPMQTPWRMLPCLRTAGIHVRERAVPQSLENKVKGAAFTQVQKSLGWSSTHRQLQNAIQWQPDKVVFQQEYVISLSKAGQATS